MVRKSIVSLATLSLLLLGDAALHTSLGLAQSRPATQPGRSSRTLVAGNLGFNLQSIRPSRNRTGGIARGGACNISQNSTPLIALLPTRATPLPNGQVAVESTTAERPTFFAYLPQSSAARAELVLMNEAQDQVLYSQEFPVPQAPGIVGITLAANAAPLEIGEMYYWSISLICDPNDRSGDIFVDGWVQRVRLNAALEQQLERANPRNRPALYAAAGVWQDTLTSLAALRLANPNDATLASDWVSLMNSVNLRAIAQSPIVHLETGNSQQP